MTLIVCSQNLDKVQTVSIAQHDSNRQAYGSHAATLRVNADTYIMYKAVQLVILTATQQALLLLFMVARQGWLVNNRLAWHRSM
jgi:hypothetical protein